MYFSSGVLHTTTTTTANQYVVTPNSLEFGIVCLYKTICVVFLTITDSTATKN